MQVIVQFFKEMSPTRLVITGFSVFFFFVMFSLYLSRVNDSDYAVLYSNLELQESAKIAQELDAKRIVYHASSDGSLIKVHKAEVVKARLELAQVGLPSTGSVVGYEIFDKDDAIGATNFSQNIKLVRALEGELSRTIAAFDEVEKARVHLVIPQREIFSKERTNPRASVVLSFRGNRHLAKTQIDAISHLVVTAVPGLEMDSVTIVDTKGRALKVGGDDNADQLANSKNELLRITEENRLRQIIENILERTIGVGKVKATVSLDMNFDRIVTNSEIYDPDGAVVRSVHTIDEREQTPVDGAGGGDASVANNIPGGAANGTSNGMALSEKSDSITNYEISKTIKNHISETGAISRMSIGILVDGIYTPIPDSVESEYTPRNNEDLQKISNLVKVAVGFDEDRGDKIEVVNMRFNNEPVEFDEETTDWLMEILPNLFQTFVFAVVVLLVLLTVIRPIALKAFEVKKISSQPGSDSSEADSDELLDNLPNIATPNADSATVNPNFAAMPNAPRQEGGGEYLAEGERKQSAVDKVNQMAESHTQDLVAVLRKWINEDA